MNVLASRLVNITTKTRQDISSTILAITDHACDKLKNSYDIATLKVVLKALCAIARTAVSEEIPTLTRAIPLVLKVAADQKRITPEALACILPLR